MFVCFACQDLMTQTNKKILKMYSQRFSPADRAGLEKMDYVFTVNGKEVIIVIDDKIMDDKEDDTA